MKHSLLFLFLIATNSLIGQSNLDDLLKIQNTRSVPYISVHELAMPKTEAIILDAREKEEYDVSHIKNSVFVGYNDFRLDHITSICMPKDQKIVVYCSLGIRSEDIATKLKKNGFTNVYNLYGGIFEWKNQGFKVYNSNNEETENVHAFSPMWGKWLLNGNKVYSLD